MTDADGNPHWKRRVQKRIDEFKDNAQSTTKRWSEQEKAKLIEVNKDIRRHRMQPMLTPNGQLRQRVDRMFHRQQEQERSRELVRKKLEIEHQTKVSLKDKFNERSRG